MDRIMMNFYLVLLTCFFGSAAILLLMFYILKHYLLGGNNRSFSSMDSAQRNSKNFKFEKGIQFCSTKLPESDFSYV